MAGKVEAFIESTKKIKEDDPLAPLALAVRDALNHTLRPGKLNDHADQVAWLKLVKKLVAEAAEVVNEHLELRNTGLYDHMLEDEMQSFNRKGQMYFLTKQTYVQAKPELGGTSNPNLITFLENHGMSEIAKKSVNAQSLRSSINNFLEENPVEITIEGDLIDCTDFGIYEALGIEDLALDDGTVKTAQQQLQERLDARHEIEQLVNITEKPTVGVRKAAK